MAKTREIQDLNLNTQRNCPYLHHFKLTMTNQRPERMGLCAASLQHVETWGLNRTVIWLVKTYSFDRAALAHTVVHHPSLVDFTVSGQLNDEEDRLSLEVAFQQETVQLPEEQGKVITFRYLNDPVEDAEFENKDAFHFHVNRLVAPSSSCFKMAECSD